MQCRIRIGCGGIVSEPSDISLMLYGLAADCHFLIGKQVSRNSLRYSSLYFYKELLVESFDYVLYSQLLYH